MELVFMRILPVSTLEDQLIRKFSKFEEQFRQKCFQDVIHNLVNLVEKSIAIEIRKQKEPSFIMNGLMQRLTI